MGHDSRKNTKLEKDLSRQHGNMEHDDSSLLQSVRFRHSSVLVDTSNWNFVAREFRFVLYSGIVLWAIHLLSQTL